MKLNVKLKENSQSIKVNFREAYKVSDGGFAAGKQSVYDDYWDTRQDYGNRTNYSYGFYQEQKMSDDFDWFYPKYDICPTKAEFFMRDAFTRDVDGTYNSNVCFDLVERLKECGIKMDFSKCTNVTYLFYQARITHLPEINLTSAGASSGECMFGGKVITVDKLIVNENCDIHGMFQYATNMTNVVIDGVIACDIGSWKNVDLTYCNKLTHDSLMSIINHLKDYSGSGNTYTLSMGAINLAKLTDGEKAIATQKGWTLA